MTVDEREKAADTTFEEMGIDPQVVKAIQEAGYDKPLEVQAACAPPAIDGRHLVVRSRTGSGKTAAFVAPLLTTLDYERREPQVLVLAPTRELALQVHDEWIKLGTYMDLHATCIYGGTGYGLQLKHLEEGVQVVTGTPGRVLDHFGRRTLNLANLDTLVLDEADEMLSAGFFEDIQKVLSACRNLKQVLLFSATLPHNIARLISRFMADPVQVDLSTDRVDVERIDNVAYMIDTTVPRARSLVSVLEAEDPACAIIFCNTKVDTEMVTSYLRRRGYSAAHLNSDLPQHKREEVMGRMKAGEQRFLVATDIAARGIDISFLPCVIHYEFPHDVELYIHRTGRTGRVDRKGRAVTLLGSSELHGLQKLAYRYELEIARFEAPPYQEAMKMLSDRRIRQIKELMEAGKVVPEEFKTIAREILSDADAESVVSFLVDEYMAKPPEEGSRIRDRDRDRDRPPPRRSGPPRRGGGGGRRR